MCLFFYQVQHEIVPLMLCLVVVSSICKFLLFGANTGLVFVSNFTALSRNFCVFLCF